MINFNSKGSIFFNISLPIILVGVFVIVIFAALNFQNLSFQIYAISALAAIFVFLFGFNTGQRFATPIQELIKKADKLSKGELGSRIYIETKDEFADLGQAFNKIAEDLEMSHREAEKAQAVSDVKVRAKTQELEEVINDLELKVRGRAQELQRMIKDSERLESLAKSKEYEILQLKKQVGSLKKPKKDARAS